MKFTERYIRDTKQYITIEEYRDILHYGKVKAPIHIVKKQKIEPYAASNRKEEHSMYCSHYEDFIPSKIITKLIKSELP